MNDKRMDKIKQHYDVFINDCIFKVISCKVDDNRFLSIKTKVFGQKFPQGGRIIINIPSENISKELMLSPPVMFKDPSIERWEYSVIQD